MQFRGFSSIAEYERECERHGLHTERRAYHKGEAGYMLMLTYSKTGITTWHLFTADESAEVLSGIVPDAAWLARSGGVDRNFSGLLADCGYIPDDPPAEEGSDAPPETAEPVLAACTVQEGDDWEQFALF